MSARRLAAFNSPLHNAGASPLTAGKKSADARGFGLLARHCLEIQRAVRIAEQARHRPGAQRFLESFEPEQVCRPAIERVTEDRHLAGHGTEVRHQQNRAGEYGEAEFRRRHFDQIMPTKKQPRGCSRFPEGRVASQMKLRWATIYRRSPENRRLVRAFMQMRRKETVKMLANAPARSEALSPKSARSSVG